MTALTLAELLTALAIIAGAAWVKVFAPPLLRARLLADWQAIQPIADDVVLWAARFGPTEGAARFALAVAQLVKLLAAKGVTLDAESAATAIQAAYARQRAAGRLAASAGSPPAPPPAGTVPTPTPTQPAP